MSDGSSFSVPSQAHVDSWNASQKVKAICGEKEDLFPIPPCPVETLRELNVNFGIEGFCSGLRPTMGIGPSTIRSLEFNEKEEIAAIKASTPVRQTDPLEPRLWYSWSDCFLVDREAPAFDFRRFEECPFSEIDTISAFDERNGIER